MMIESLGTIEENAKIQQQIGRQLQQYRRINASLKKKIQNRDRKINSLFMYLDTTSKPEITRNQNPETIPKNSSELQFSTATGIIKKQHPQTEIRKKEKSNHNNQNSSIFKERILTYERVQPNEYLKLPTLPKTMIVDQQMPESSEVKPRIIRISKEKLIPLKSDEVRRKFERKFNKDSIL